MLPRTARLPKAYAGSGVFPPSVGGGRPPSVAGSYGYEVRIGREEIRELLVENDFRLAREALVDPYLCGQVERSLGARPKRVTNEEWARRVRTRFVAKCVNAEYVCRAEVQMGRGDAAAAT